jgi:DUF4097 and DUF4098 domain-containing protein YvlB
MRRESFHTPGKLTLTLHMPNGEIEVQAVEGEETVVSLLTSSDREEVRRAIEQARIELRSRGDGNVVVVDVEKRSRLLGFDRGEITMHVTAPRAADVEISTASADIDLRGTLGALKAQVASGDLRAEELNGRVDIKSASGDVELQVVAGDASVATASGDIYVRAVHGEAMLRSASGDVQVEEAADSLTVQTASGDQSVGSVTSGRVVMQSASGDQQVGIKRGSRVHLDVKTLSGDASSELDVGDAAPAGDGPIIDLRATSMSGDIRVARA